MKIHYAGALRIKKKSGTVVDILPGYAACVTGRAAHQIRLERRHTYEPKLVTCEHCLKQIERSIAPSR